MCASLAHAVHVRSNVIAYEWRWLFNDESGLVNYICYVLGLIHERLAWLGNTKTAMMSVIVADAWFSTPFVTLLFIGGLQSLPVEPYESAAIDGANSWQRFWLLTLPMLRPVVLAVILLRTMDAIKTFDLIYIMTNGGPGLRTEMIMTYSYKVAFATFRLGAASAIAVVGLVLMLLFSLGITLAFRERTQRTMQLQTAGEPNCG